GAALHRPVRRHQPAGRRLLRPPGDRRLRPAARPARRARPAGAVLPRRPPQRARARAPPPPAPRRARPPRGFPPARAQLRKVLTTLGWTGLYPLWHRLRGWDPRRLSRAARFRRWNHAAGAGEIVLRPGLRLAIDPRSREPFEWFCFRSLEMS